MFYYWFNLLDFPVMFSGNVTDSGGSCYAIMSIAPSSPLGHSDIGHVTLPSFVAPFYSYKKTIRTRLRTTTVRNFFLIIVDGNAIRVLPGGELKNFMDTGQP